MAELKSQEEIFSEIDLILIKPNFNTADPFPSSTDTEFLSAVVDFFEDKKVKKIIIGESSTFYKSTEKVIERKNLGFLKDKKRVEIINFNRAERVEVRIPDGKYLQSGSIPKVVQETDMLIYLPCLKTHFLSGFSASLKLSVGFLNRKEKLFLHAGNLEEKIVELNKILTPDLIIADGRKCFITGGPVKGKVEAPGILLASTDSVAMDLEAVKTIMKFPDNNLEGKDPGELIQIKRAGELGLGAINYQLIDV